MNFELVQTKSGTFTVVDHTKEGRRDESYGNKFNLTLVDLNIINQEYGDSKTLNEFLGKVSLYLNKKGEFNIEDEEERNIQMMKEAKLKMKEKSPLIEKLKGTAKSIGVASIVTASLMTSLISIGSYTFDQSAYASQNMVAEENLNQKELFEINRFGYNDLGDNENTKYNKIEDFKIVINANGEGGLESKTFTPENTVNIIAKSEKYGDQKEDIFYSLNNKDINSKGILERSKGWYINQKESYIVLEGKKMDLLEAKIDLFSINTRDEGVKEFSTTSFAIKSIVHQEVISEGKITDYNFVINGEQIKKENVVNFFVEITENAPGVNLSSASQEWKKIENQDGTIKKSYYLHPEFLDYRAFSTGTGGERYGDLDQNLFFGDKASVSYENHKGSFVEISGKKIQLQNCESVHIVYKDGKGEVKYFLLNKNISKEDGTKIVGATLYVNGNKINNEDIEKLSFVVTTGSGKDFVGSLNGSFFFTSKQVDDFERQLLTGKVLINNHSFFVDTKEMSSLSYKLKNGESVTYNFVAKDESTRNTQILLTGASIATGLSALLIAKRRKRKQEEKK